MIPGYPQLSLLNAEKRRETSFLLANLEHFPAPNDPGIIFAQGGKRRRRKGKEKRWERREGVSQDPKNLLSPEFYASLPPTCFLSLSIKVQPADGEDGNEKCWRVNSAIVCRLRLRLRCNRATTKIEWLSPYSLGSVTEFWRFYGALR